MHSFLALCALMALPLRATAGNFTLLSTGTVLFGPSDISRECWSPEGVALLTSRMLMSDAMPPPEKLIAESNRFVSDIIEYFRLLLQVVRSNTSGRTKHIMLLAATDTMGGYMRHLVLPVAKYAYYAGRIEYPSVVKLYQLYDELKNYLRTNGNGWAGPWRKAGLHVKAEALSLQGPPPSTDPCRGLVYYQTKPDRTKSHIGSCSVEVPLPFFDSKSHPSAIAVPFRTFGLRNLESRVSAYILVKFYVAVNKCMASRNTNDDDVSRFNMNFFAFVNGKVMPHLGDDKFYAAFGGVLRILETIKKVSKGKVTMIGNVNVVPEQEDREPALMTDDDTAAAETDSSKDRRSKNNLILLAALATIIIWFCLGAAFICCRIKATKQAKPITETEDTDACREDTCPAFERTSSHSTYNSEKPPAPSASKASKRSSKSTKSSKSSVSRTTTLDPDSDSQSALAAAAAAAAAAGEGSRGASVDKSAKIQVHSVQYYPPSFACHSSMAGKVRPDSSTEDYTSREEQPTKRPYVFGYDFQTTSEESSPRDHTTDGENEMGGNMSK